MGAAEEKMITAVLKSFSSALRKIPLYPASHPMVQDAVTGLYLGLQEFLQQYGVLSLDVFENSLMVCEQPLDGPLAAKDVVQDFKKAGIEGVTINPGVTEEELKKFLTVTTLKPDEVKQRGGFSEIFKEEDLSHVSLNEVRYARIKEEEQVTKKDEVPAEEQQDAAQKKAKDIVAEVSSFLSGQSEDVPEKEAISFEFKKHSRRLVRQLLKLVGPEKAVEEVLRMIEERFARAGFSKEEQDIYINKLKTEIIKIKAPKVTKGQLEKEVKKLQKEIEALQAKLKDVDTVVQVNTLQRLLIAS